ncbi:MAG: hypothetical protein WC724_00350 [Candidatus Paceibacterota bacterium]
MNKKELQQVLTEINQRLTALGDLNSLVQQGQGLPNLINDAQTKKTNIDSFLNDLPTRSEELNRITTEVKSLNEQVITREGEVSDLVEKTKELQQKVEEFIKETQAQLGVAANAKLASTFEGVKDELGKEKIKWFWWLVGAVVVLIIATVGIVVWQILEKETIFEVSFLIKVALTSPIVYFVVFTSREYGRIRNLIEEYTFKAAIARSFEAYKNIIEEIFSDYQSTTYQQKLDFILGAVTDLYSSPMKNIKDNHVKEKENSPDLFSKVNSVVSGIAKPTNQ